MADGQAGSPRKPAASGGEEIVLSAENLTKRFGDREAVSDVSFEVHAGEVFGFLGPNGAGKTTTIRMLVGLARPDRGRVKIRGLDLAHHFTRAMAHVGAIVESPDLYRYLTGRENLEHFARMLPPGAGGRIAELGELVALSDRLHSDHPLGAPMVSSEGACAAYYRYRRQAIRPSGTDT